MSFFETFFGTFFDLSDLFFENLPFLLWICDLTSDTCSLSSVAFLSKTSQTGPNLVITLRGHSGKDDCICDCDGHGELEGSVSPECPVTGHSKT